MSWNKQSFFLLSFLPALAYWVLELNFSIQVAIIGGMFIGLLEMGLEKKITGYVHTLSKLNLALILGLGGLSFLEQEGLFFKLQPTFTGLALFSFLAYKNMKKESLFLTMLKEMNKKSFLPDFIFFKLEKHLATFLLFFSLFMTWITISYETEVWLFWKTIGFYMMFTLFFISEFFWIKIKLNKMSKK